MDILKTKNEWCLLVSFLSLCDCNLSTPACPVTKRRHRLRLTISLLIAYFPDNDGFLYIIPYITALSLSQQSSLHTLIIIRIVCGGGGRYKDRTTNWRRCAVLLNWRSRQRKALSCWAFIKIKYIKISQPVQMCRVCARDQNAIDIIHSDRMIGIKLFQLEIGSKVSM